MDKTWKSETIFYLVSLVPECGRSCREVRRRIALGKKAFNKKKVMQKSLSLHQRKCMAKVFVWSVVLYRSETWTLQKEDIWRLKAFEMWIWRRMIHY